MSNYHYGTYTSTTPRVQSSGFMFDRNGAPISYHSKPQRSATKSPEAPKRSPSKKSKKGLKVQLDSNLKGLLTPVENKKIEFGQSPTSKGLKRKSKGPKGNRKKSNSPPKDVLYSNLDGKKKSLAGYKHQIMTNDYENDLVVKQKSNSVKSVSMHQDWLDPESYEAEFANWLSKKVVSSNKNAYNSKGRVHNSELMSPKYLEERGNSETANLQNIWPEPKKGLKSENLSHRQSLDMPNSVKGVKKSLQNQLSAFSGQSEGKSKSIAIASQKPSTPKGSFNQGYKASPRVQDPYVAMPSPLSAQNQNVMANKKNGLESHSLRDSYNYEFPKDNRSNMRASLDANEYSSEPVKTGKHVGNFYKDGASPSQLEGSSIKFEIQTGNPTNEESEVVPARVRYAKHSDPNIVNDLNAYMGQMMNGKSKRASDSQIQGYPGGHGDGENNVLSTRSALDRHENRFAFQQNVGDNEYQSNHNVKRIHSSSQPSKEMLGNGGLNNEEDKIANEIVTELLKRNNTKDIKVNPNAKFLLLRKQIQEKRSKQNFKSADWNSPHYEMYSGDASPNLARNSCKEENGENPQLSDILNKTKRVLATYKNKENTWVKEKKLLVAEIEHLRSVIENS